MLGSVVFRADSVHDNGKIVVLRAKVRSSAVVDALERFRPSAWSGKRSTRPTYAGRSFAVRVIGVSTRTAASRSTGIEVALERAPDEDPHGTTMSFSLNGSTYSGDDITEIGLRRNLFGQPAPAGLLSLGGFPGESLAELSVEGLPVELQKATIGLLVTEALVGSRRATRINAIRVSPPGPNGCRLILNWTGRHGSGRPPEDREIDGWASSI